MALPNTLKCTVLIVLLLTPVLATASPQDARNLIEKSFLYNQQARWLELASLYQPAELAHFKATMLRAGSVGHLPVPTDQRARDLWPIMKQAIGELPATHFYAYTLKRYDALILERAGSYGITYQILDIRQKDDMYLVTYRSTVHLGGDKARETQTETAPVQRQPNGRWKLLLPDSSWNKLGESAAQIRQQAASKQFFPCNHLSGAQLNILVQLNDMANLKNLRRCVDDLEKQHPWFMFLQGKYRGMIDYTSGSPLLVAINQNNQTMVEYFLKSGLSPNSTDDYGMPGITITENPAMIRFLIKHGADINQRFSCKRTDCGENNTPLSFAARGKLTSVLVAMLESGKASSESLKDSMKSVSEDIQYFENKKTLSKFEQEYLSTLKQHLKLLNQNIN